MASTFLSQTKLVIFDVDGVIFDIIDAIRDTVKTGMEKYQLQLDFQEAMEEVSRTLEIVQTMPIPQMILNANEVLNIKLLEGKTVLQKLRIGGSFYGDYRSRKASCRIFPGIKEILAKLYAEGFKCAILSNNKRSYVLDALAKEDLAKYFSQILGFNEVTHTKPHPEGLLKILALEQCPPEQAIFIGDMPTDIQAGNNARLRTVAVTSGLSSKTKLAAQNPTRVVENIQELHDLFFASP